MARYEHLPIYKKSMDLAVYIEEVVRGFPRYHKYSLGADLRNVSRHLAILVMKANSSGEKGGILTELRDKTEEFKQLLTIGKELKVFRSFRQFETAALLAVEISRQSEGWLASQTKKGTESRHA